MSTLTEAVIAYEAQLNTVVGTFVAANAAAEGNAALTAADRLQTGEDRIAASGSATDALASKDTAVSAQLDITQNWSDKLATASTQAAESAASAGASEASRQASGASAGLAATAKVQAEAARDASFVTGPKYSTEALGRAAVADGINFMVQGDGEVATYEYRRVSSGVVSTLIASYPSIAAVQAREKLTASTKNLFNPLTDIISGYMYLAGGGQQFNADYRVTKKYPIAAGQYVSISGLAGAKNSAFPFMHFWNEAAFVSSVALPAGAGLTDYLTEIAPADANYFSLNLNGAALPARLQIELAPAPTPYQPARLLDVGLAKEEVDNYLYVTSSKNLYDGGVLSKYNQINTGLQLTASDDSAVTSFIPVSYGKYYRISGLDPALVTSTILRRIVGYSTARIVTSTGAVKAFAAWSETGATVYIDDVNVKFIVVQLSVAGSGGSLVKAKALRVQVEEGQTATTYEPRKLPIALQTVLPELAAARASSEATNLALTTFRAKHVLSFDEFNAVNSGIATLTLQAFDKLLGPHGISYGVTGNALTEAACNNVMATETGFAPGARKLYARVAAYVDDAVSVAKLAVTPFSIPSGMLDNTPSLPYQDTAFPNDNYAHPSIAYSAAGVAGYKYWMVSSVLPAYGTNAIWEDEDVFVSNDAQTWLRVRSLYEADKSYTTATLRLPPNDFATDARRNGFLPCPGAGEVLEISTPADNGRASTDRVSVTVGTSPWKHDPAILIDGGYVYVYHSFHIPQGADSGGKHRFMVCTRTADGINWEAVRNDGSTLALDSATAVRQLFTKDGSGRYNFMYYAYTRSNMNPEVIKYGEGDYELVYGYNFSARYKGTSPWSFDFSTPFPIQDLGVGNHPGLLHVAPNLYQVNSKGFYVSTDRGVTFTKYAYTPYWLGGVSGIQYKKAMCVGEGGKVFLVEAKRNNGLAYVDTVENAFVSRTEWHKQTITEFASLSALIGFAQNGIIDGYIDVQVEQVNYAAGTRKSMLFPYIGNKSTAALVHNPHQKVFIGDLVVSEGDRFFFMVTLTARNGAKVRFNGLEVA